MQVQSWGRHDLGNGRGLVLTNYRVVAGVRLRVMRGGKISFVDVNLGASGRAA